jgi:hypothetical protein
MDLRNGPQKWLIQAILRTISYSAPSVLSPPVSPLVSFFSSSQKSRKIAYFLLYWVVNVSHMYPKVGITNKLFKSVPH